MGGRPPILFESESLSGDFEKSRREEKGSPEGSGGDIEEDGFDPERGGYDKVGTLCARDYKGISNKSPFDRKVVIEKNNAETKTVVDDVVSWRNRDKMSKPKVNLADPVTSTDYKEPALVAYHVPKKRNGNDDSVICVQTANTSSNGSNFNDDISATLAKNNTLAVMYKDEK